MARALARDARLIVMDEPSAVLDPEEVAEPVPGDPRAHRRRRRGRLHLAPARGDPRRSATGSRCSRTAARSPATCRPRSTPTAEVIRLMTGRSIEYVFPPRGAPPRPRRGARGRGPDPDRRVRRRLVHGARRRGRRARRAGRLRPLGDPGDGLRRPQAVRGHGPRARAGAAPPARCPRPCGPGMGLCPEERKSQGLLLAEPVSRNVSLPACAGSPGRASCGRDAELAAVARGHRAARRAAAGPEPAGPHAVRRQPAEGGAGPLAAARLRRAAARRAHPRRRRRRAQPRSTR